MQGVIQSTASEATLVALLAAKARAVQGRPAEDAHKVVAYCSDQAHSSGERVGEGDAGGWWLLRLWGGFVSWVLFVSWVGSGREGRERGKGT